MVGDIGKRGAWMNRHLILQLEAPLMAFGETMIDATGPTRDMPIVSGITGLIANAFGWRRGERDRHQRLQARIVMATRLDRPGKELRDYQTALLFEDEAGWTTHGTPEGRAKSPSYRWGASGRKELTHQRERFYRADAFVSMALRLEPGRDDEATLDEVEAALDRPARPLFIGRKPCLPSRRIVAGAIEAPTTVDALVRWPLRPSGKVALPVTIIAPVCEPEPAFAFRTLRLTDQRNWISGVHAGESEVRVLAVPRAAFNVSPPVEDESP